MKLIAIKPVSYGTRHFQAGDVFETKTERDGKLLLAVKKVRQVEDRPEQKLAAPPKTLINKIKESEKVIEEKEPEVTEEAPAVAEVTEPESTEAPEVTETPEPTKTPEEEEEKPFVRTNHTTGRGRNRKN